MISCTPANKSVSHSASMSSADNSNDSNSNDSNSNDSNSNDSNSAKNSIGDQLNHFRNNESANSAGSYSRGISNGSSRWQRKLLSAI